MFQDGKARLTLQEYLERDEQSEWRHEFVDGEIFTMTGPSVNHQLIVTNLAAHISSHARAGGCQTFPGIRVLIESLNTVYIPDVVVRCGPLEGNPLFITDPVLIIEVLSSSTSSIDRREKRNAYRAIPSVREYIIIDQYRMCIQVWRKEDAPIWTESQVYISNSELPIRSLTGCGTLVLSLKDIYMGTSTPPDGSLEIREDVEQYYLHAIKLP